MEDKVRLGGMALGNGVLVHGPTSWACAVRLPDGSLKVAAERKRDHRRTGSRIRSCAGRRGSSEAVAVLPTLKRRLPEAKLPFEQPRILAAMVASAVGVRVIRGSRLGPAAQELAAGALALAPALLSLRGSDLAAYHGAEHISIGSYEHGEPRTREHERCGSHLIGPLLATSAAANAVTASVPAALPQPGPRRRVARGACRGDRALRLDGAQSRQEARARAREARARAPAPLRDEGAERRAGRGRRGGAPRVPRARAVERLRSEPGGHRSSIGSVERTTCMPAAAKRANAASASSV